MRYSNQFITVSRLDFGSYRHCIEMRDDRGESRWHSESKMREYAAKKIEIEPAINTVSISGSKMMDSRIRVRLFNSLLICGLAGQFSSANIPVELTVKDAHTGTAITEFVVVLRRIAVVQLEEGAVDANRHQQGKSEFIRFKDPEGRFKQRIDLDRVQQIRVFAPDFGVQTIFWDRDEIAGGLKATVRLRRSQVKGKVVDHLGQPVANAFIYAANNRISFTDQPPPNTFAISNEDGEFQIRTANCDTLVVSSKTCIGWSFSLVDSDPTNAIIQLPQPTELTIQFAIDGAPEEEKVFYQLLTDQKDDQTHVALQKTTSIGNGKSKKLRDLPPGRYQFCRYRMHRCGNTARSSMIDRTFIELKPGDAKRLDFVRKSGATIFGRVKIAQNADLAGVVVRVKSVDSVQSPWTEHRFDHVVDSRRAGEYKSDYHLAPSTFVHFVTERLLPGEYDVEAIAYDREAENQQKFLGGFEHVEKNVVRKRIVVSNETVRQKVQLAFEKN